MAFTRIYKGKKRMARVSTYLNFPGNTEQAFIFYQSLFGGEFLSPPLRFKDMPPQAGQPPMDAAVGNMIMHIELAIIGGHVIMATDAPASMGFTLKYGNNMCINLELDTRAEMRGLFQKLNENGHVEMQLSDMFWGAYFGIVVDQFGVRWMLNCEK